jgi:hypothetical protein
MLVSRVASTCVPYTSVRTDDATLVRVRTCRPLVVDHDVCAHTSNLGPRLDDRSPRPMTLFVNAISLTLYPKIQNIGFFKDVVRKQITQNQSEIQSRIWRGSHTKVGEAGDLIISIRETIATREWRLCCSRTFELSPHSTHTILVVVYVQYCLSSTCRTKTPTLCTHVIVVFECIPYAYVPV